jgi:hypothetical protein
VQAFRAEALCLAARTVYDAALFQSASPLQFGGDDDHWLVRINDMLVVPTQPLACFPRRAVDCHRGLLLEYAGLLYITMTAACWLGTRSPIGTTPRRGSRCPERDRR